MSMYKFDAQYALVLTNKTDDNHSIVASYTTLPDALAAFEQFKTNPTTIAGALPGENILQIQLMINRQEWGQDERDIVKCSLLTEQCLFVVDSF